MPAPYKFTILIDGHICSGTWDLKQGGRVKVSCPGWGVETVDCAPGQHPEGVATKAAERIVKAYHKARAAELKRRQREVARVNRYWDKQKLTTPTNDA